MEYVTKEALYKLLGDKPKAKDDSAAEKQRIFDWASFRNMIRQMPSTEVSDWIMIESREPDEMEENLCPDKTNFYMCKMPENGEEVLVVSALGNVSIDKFILLDDGDMDFEDADINDIVAWMPLPKAPWKEQE